MTRAIVPIGAWFLACGLASVSAAATFGFDSDAVDRLPVGWSAGATGAGAPRWTVEHDATAPTQPNVLVQSGRADFAWCVRREADVTDGFVEVRFKPISGREDRAGGVIWRWKDGDNYYVARANALENNVSLYYTRNGKRNTIAYANAPVTAGAWHVLRVEFSGQRIAVALDGKVQIEHSDAHISGGGAVGVWTKADSVTAFDDFSYGISGSR
jgi:hypothetical protein